MEIFQISECLNGTEQRRLDLSGVADDQKRANLRADFFRRMGI